MHVVNHHNYLQWGAPSLLVSTVLEGYVDFDVVKT